MARKKKRTAKREFKSPIEVMLRNGIVLAAKSRGVCLRDYSTSVGKFAAVFHEGEIMLVDGPDDRQCEEWGDPDGPDWCLFGEVGVESYHVDFLLQTGGDFVAIECDGHEFHDRTKQQAAYDRSRDRELLALGINTVRFTGSEIHHSIDRCVDDIYRIGKRLHALHVNRISAVGERHRELRFARDGARCAEFGADTRFGDEGRLRGVLSGVV